MKTAQKETAMSIARTPYSCRACGARHAADALARGAWGDRCCPACGSPDVERSRSRWSQIYATFFLYKVY
jgi:ribosomal protein L37AE/L43A